MADKVYVVEDSDPDSEPKSTTGIFPGTLRGLLDALEAARFRSAAGTPKSLVIVEGKRRQGLPSLAPTVSGRCDNSQIRLCHCGSV